MTDITIACNTFDQIKMEAHTLPDSSCKTTLLGSLSFNILTCDGFTDPVSQTLGQNTLNDVTQRQNELEACKALSPTTATSDHVTPETPTDTSSTSASPSSLLSQAIQDLIALFNTTNSSTIAPNCCAGPIQADINLLIQLATTYEENFAANSESIIYNFVQGLNSNIEFLKANWTECETSGLCCNASSITTTLLPTTTLTTLPPTTSTTLPTTTTSTTTTSTTAVPTSTTLGPNITACAMTQNFGSSSFICFPDSTIRFGFNNAALACSRLRMSLLTITTDTELGYFNSFWTSLLNIFASNEFYVNALRNGTYFYTSDGTKITATISGSLGSCLTLKKGLLGLRYTLTTGTCSTAKNFLCQFN